MGLVGSLVIFNYNNKNLKYEDKTDKEKNSIKYEKKEYTCKVGETFDTMIKTTEALATIVDFKSSSPNVASIESGTIGGDSTNCSNCMAVHIYCKMEGTVNLYATSSTGNTTKAIVIITK